MTVSNQDKPMSWDQQSPTNRTESETQTGAVGMQDQKEYIHKPTNEEVQIEWESSENVAQFGHMKSLVHIQCAARRIGSDWTFLMPLLLVS